MHTNGCVLIEILMEIQIRNDAIEIKSHAIKKSISFFGKILKRRKNRTKAFHFISN